MKIAAITCSVVMWLTSIFSMAVPIPYLPYVPPHDAQLWDLVFNIFGITAPDIEDVEERASAYWNIYRDALGAGYGAFEQDMRDVFDTAKTGGALVIGAGTGIALGALQAGMQEALENGMSYGEGVTDPTTAQRVALLQQKVLEKWGVTMSDTSAQNVISAWSGYGYPYMLVTKVSSTAYRFTICTVATISGSYWYVSKPARYSSANINNHLGMGNSWVNLDVTNSRYSTVSETLYLGTYAEFGVTAEVANVAAQSAATAAAIGAGTLIPVTAETVLNNGVIDDTKPVKIRLPLTDLPVGATEVSGLAGVQDKVDAVPNTEVQDLSEIIQEMQEKQAATYGDTGEFAVDLTSYFPFCIPFDLYKMLLALGAEPEAPSIDFPMITGIEDGEITTVNLHISLEFMDNLMQFVRTGELIFSTLGLAMLTAKVIKW